MEISQLIGRKQFTVLLGKNGAGKSTLLRSIDSKGELNTRYITPERGGELKYEPSIDQSMATSEGWLDKTRRKNRFESFRQQSAAQFRNLEIFYLRELEKDLSKRSDPNSTFDSIIDRINRLLPAIKLIRSDRGFSLASHDGQPISESSISSGESEFIAQAIEVLVFSRQNKQGKILLLDEPDVHLHPDLQHKFAKFIEEAANEYKMKVVVATHSTAFVAGFSPDADLQIVPVSVREQSKFEAFSRSEISDQLLPIFGAHPLSNVFNESPIVLVEGEDDRRIIEQAVRSSQGRVRMSPCPVGSVDELGQWEIWLEKMLPAIYDNPVAFSLRDLDGAADCSINDLRIVKRARLNCYAMENLLLCDESLAIANSSSDQLLSGLQTWLEKFPLHPAIGALRGLIDRFDDRRILKIKDARNVVLALIGITKPWEVHLGQLLASESWHNASTDNCLNQYLGPKASALLSGKLDLESSRPIAKATPDASMEGAVT